MTSPTLIDRKEVERRTTLSRSQIYALMTEGRFPRQVKLGRSVAWVALEVDEWIDAKIAERDGRAGAAHSA